MLALSYGVLPAGLAAAASDPAPACADGVACVGDACFRAFHATSLAAAAAGAAAAAALARRAA